MKDEGYYLMLLGDSVYKTMGKSLIKNIRVYDEIRPITILTDDPSQFVNDDINIIRYDSTTYLDRYKISNIAKYELYNTFPKLDIPLVSPYKKTLYIDTDCFIITPIERLWSLFTTDDRGIGISGRADKDNRGPETSHWNTIREIESICGVPLPYSIGSFFYSNKDKLPDYERLITKYINDYETYRIKRQFRKAINDEIIMCMYMGATNIRPFDYDDYKLFEHSSEKYAFTKFDYSIYHDFVLKLYLHYYDTEDYSPFCLEKYKRNYVGGMPPDPVGQDKYNKFLSNIDVIFNMEIKDEG